MPEIKSSNSQSSGEKIPFRRNIVSFVRRGARMTTAQERSWNQHSNFYVLDLPRGDRDTLAAEGVKLDPKEIFGNDNPLIVEIGSGMGDCLSSAAASRPDYNFLAFEVYRPGIAQTITSLDRLGLPRNVRMLELDAQHTITQLLPKKSIAELWIFFADPWRKTKHHKRRLVSTGFLTEVLPLIQEGGLIRSATDWAHYGNHQHVAYETVAAQTGQLVNLYPEGPRPAGTTTDEVPEEMPVKGFAPRFDGRVLTAFEAKAGNAGRLVWEFAYQKA